MDTRFSRAFVIGALALAVGADAAGAQDCAQLSLVERLGPGTSGTSGQPQLRLIGKPAVGQPQSALRVEGGPPGALAQLIVGTPGAPTPLPHYGATLFVAPPLTRLLLPLDGQGASRNVGGGDGPTPAALCGFELAAQALVADAQAQGGAAFTRALRLRFGLGSGASALFDGMLLPEINLGFSGPMEVGDLDGNGRADIVAPTGGSATRFDAFYQLGDGGFAKVQSKGTSFGSRDLDLGDIDGDGRLDVVVLTGDSISAALGQADGMLAPLASATSATGSTPRALELADMDGDGALDAVTLGWAADAVGVHLNDGDGSFDAPVLAPIGLPTVPLSFTVADVDLDGRTDVALLVGDPAGNVAVLYGLGGGTLGAPLLAAAGDAPVSGLALADAAGDARLDLLVSTRGGDASGPPASIRVLENLGAGFAPPVILQEESELLAVYDGLTVGDLNDNGVLDAIVPGRVVYHQSFEPYTTTGAATYSFHDLGTGAASILSVEAGAPSFARLALVDGDAHLDLIQSLTVIGPHGAMHMLHGTGDGGFAEPPLFDELAGSGVVGDFDEDGLADVAVRNPDDTPSIRIGFGARDALLVPAATLPLPSTVRRIVAGRLDGDGHLDLVTFMNSIQLAVLRGDGDGGFGAAASFAAPAGLEAQDSIALADVGGDGLLDLVILETTTSPFSSAPSAIHVLPGLGDGSFGPALSATLAPSAAKDVRAGDLNGDGRADVAYVSDKSDQVLVALAAAGGGWEAPLPVDDVDFAYFMLAPELGDLDDDGDLDLVYVYDLLHLRAALNDGLGHFTPLPPTEAFPGFRLGLADLDGDDRLDLVSTGVSLGLGDGSFTQHVLGGLSPNWIDGPAGDFDGDGDLDLFNVGRVLVNTLH